MAHYFRTDEANDAYLVMVDAGKDEWKLLATKISKDALKEAMLMMSFNILQNEDEKACDDFIALANSL